MKSPWPTKKLGEICNFIFGFSFRADDFNDKGLGMPVIRTGDLNNLRKTEKFYIGPYKDEYLVESGDILIGLSGTIISGIWQGPRALLNQRVVKLTNFRNVEKKFIGYILPLPLKKLSEELTKSAVKNVLKNHLANLEIPLPPLHIQQKIVKILDTIQSAVEVQERIIEKTKELKKSLMAELFKYGGPSFRKGRKLKKTEVGEIPEDWEVVRLGEVIEIFDSKRIPLSEEERQNMKGPYPYCGANGIIDYINDYIFDGEYVLLAEDGGYWGPLEESSYIMKGKFWVNNHAHIFRALKDKAINFYLMSILNYLNLNDYIGGATRGKLNQSNMRNIKIPLPPLPEQQEIAEILQTIDQKIEIEKKKKELHEELFRTMLNKIMNQEIDVEKIEV
jgi:type I restriction enzyme, S subunit